MDMFFNFMIHQEQQVHMQIDLELAISLEDIRDARQIHGSSGAWQGTLATEGNQPSHVRI